MLEDYGIPYFRMTDCASDPGHGPFTDMSKPDRIAVATRAINLVKQYMAYGIALSLDMRDAKLIPKQGLYDSPYTYLCWNALIGVKHWIRTHNYRGDVAYFFESGHANQSEANRIMSKLFDDQGMRDAYRYTSHTFADKKKVNPLQCADILAWQWFTNQKRIEGGTEGVRADFKSLLEKNHWTTHFD